MVDKKFQEQDLRFTQMLQQVDYLYEEYAKAKGLTLMSMSVLDTIYSCKGECTQKLICEQTHYPKQSVNVVIKSFWISGYVELKEFPDDRRNKQICLTKAGKKFAKEVLVPLDNADKNATLMLTEQQRDEALKMLTIFTNAFKKEIKKAME